MNLGVKPQTQEGVVECFFVSDVTTQKWGGLGLLLPVHQIKYLSKSPFWLIDMKLPTQLELVLNGKNLTKVELVGDC